MDADVLIVGAGPTGLMLANQLVRRGVRVTLIERHAGPARETRALGVQARTLEIYQKLGVLERALELGKSSDGAALWANGKRQGRILFGDVGQDVSPFAFIFVLGQDDNERILGERLRDWNLAVQWNTELVALEEHHDHVAATLRSADGTTRTLTASWIAGCDGARSSVRELNHIDFPGAPYEHVFFVADVEATGSMIAEEVNGYLWHSTFHLFFPMRGNNHWRIVGIVPPNLRDKPGLSFDDVLEQVRTSGSELSFASCSWFSTYRIHHRAAARFRQGRSFLLGDAAHIHSPVGAQGMNTGLQDAYNLGWKLALVVKGKANAVLLDSYEGERIPVAEKLLKTTDRAFKLVVSDNPLVAFLRTQVFARIGAFAMNLKPAQALAFRTISQTGVNYRNGPLAEQIGTLPADAVQAGDRFPWLKLRLRAGGPIEDLYATLDDTHFHLFAFGQTLSGESIPALADRLQVHEIPSDADNNAELERKKIPRPSFYFVRQDGHVGFCGTAFDAPALAEYIRECLQMN